MAEASEQRDFRECVGSHHQIRENLEATVECAPSGEPYDTSKQALYTATTTGECSVARNCSCVLALIVPSGSMPWAPPCTCEGTPCRAPGSLASPCRLVVEAQTQAPRHPLRIRGDHMRLTLNNGSLPNVHGMGRNPDCLALPSSVTTPNYTMGRP
jgi:hypothetical protein